MENNKIYVDVDEFERLCRVDGRMDALISYLELNNSDYITRPIMAIIGMEISNKKISSELLGDAVSA